MRIFRVITALFLLIPTLFACKKDASSNSNSCRIVATYDSNFSSNGTYASSSRIYYDNDGRMAYQQLQWPTESQTRVFSYRDSMVIETPTTDRMSIDSTWLNGKGKVVKVSYTFPGTQYSYLTYSYDGSGQLQSSTSGPNNKVTTTYKFENGDCVSTTGSDGTSTIFTYYTNMATRLGDPQTWNDQVQSAIGIVFNAHLVKTAKYGNFLSEYSYTFDNTGKIETVTTREGAIVNKVRYEYDCSPQ